MSIELTEGAVLIGANITLNEGELIRAAGGVTMVNVNIN